MRQPNWPNIGITVALIGVAWSLTALACQYREIRELKAHSATARAKAIDHETRIAKTEQLDAVKVRSLKQMDRDLRAQGTATVEANRRAERAERLVKGKVWERRVIPSVSPWVVYRGGLER